ncbi:hypothetical protein OB13_16310, partial [Pontibacter sp. HJ8]
IVILGNSPKQVAEYRAPVEKLLLKAWFVAGTVLFANLYEHLPKKFSRYTCLIRQSGPVPAS